MSKIARLAVFVAMLTSLFAVMSSTAGAVTWDVTGASHFTATAGAGTLSSTGVNLNCQSSSATAKTTTGNAGLVAPVVHATLSFASCLLSGQAVGVECGVTLTASAQTGNVTTGDADVTCGVYLAGIKTCHIEGKVHATYTTPVTATSTPGVLATTTGGTFTTTNAAANCALGNGDPAHLSVLTYRVTGPDLGPHVTRTG